MIPKLLRALAIIIAVVGAIDPAISAARRVKPEVAVIASDTAQVELAARVRERLDKRFEVLPSPPGSSTATVLVGRTLPEAAADIAGPAFAVLPEPEAVRIEAVHAPSATDLSTQTTVTAEIRVTNSAGRELEVALTAGGLALDHSTVRVTTQNELVRVPLRFIPYSAGSSMLGVEARISGEAMTSADLAIDVRDRRSAILFFDPRPSWLSTFVRRTIEEDARFIVSSRSITARTVGVDVGTPPVTLIDPAALELYDVIVVGAPDQLSADAVTALETFLRRRGGSVVLLPDNDSRGPYERLIGVQHWTKSRRPQSVAIGDQLQLRAASLLVPAPLPAGASPIARVDTTAVIWSTAVGAGRLIFSGALDSWRYRDAEQSQFGAFWRQLISLAAAQVVSPITVDIANQPVTPGASTEFTVTLRSAALSELQPGRVLRAAASAELVAPNTRIPLRLWPGAVPGRFRGKFDAPEEPGTYTLKASFDGVSADAPLLVAAHAPAQRDDSELITQWTEAHGGRTIRVDQLDELVPALEHILKPEVRPETWHPLRSAWWMLPFTLLLAAEWWWRRRHGLP